MGRAILCTTAVALVGCMHIDEQRHYQDVPGRMAASSKVRPGSSHLGLEWAQPDGPKAIRLWVEDTCVQEGSLTYSRTISVERTIEGTQSQLITTAVMAGVFGLTGGVLLAAPESGATAATGAAASAKGTADPERPDNRQVAGAMGWTAAGVVAFSALWALVTVARSRDYVEAPVEMQRPLTAIETPCNRRPIERETVVADYGDRRTVVGQGWPDAEGLLVIDQESLGDAMVRDRHPINAHPLAVRVQRLGYFSQLRIPSSFSLQLEPRRQEFVAEQWEAAAKREAAETQEDERRVRQDRQARIARGDCLFDGSKGVQCELLLCARIAAKVRSMSPGSGCADGAPFASLRSNWTQALFAIDNYLDVLRSRGDMAAFWRIQGQVRRCVTPQWFRSCSN